MLARIYKPAKTAMQSGTANVQKWILEFEPESAREIEPLMGWTSSADMLNSQVRLKFSTKEEAVSFAHKHNIPFQVFEPHEPPLKRKAYADNFRYDRTDPWTH